SRDQIVEASQYGRIDSLQPPYSLFWRQVETEAMPYCVENNISILAYSSLAQGLLTGKFGRHLQLEEGDHRAKNKLFKGENYQRVQQALAQLRPIAERHQCTLAQLSLAWLIGQPQTNASALGGRVNAIAGARHAEQASQNALSAEVKLSGDELQEIDAIGRLVTDPLDNNPIMWDWDS
ncbi:MAG TPA: aldo/keto reductase, partial [Stenomitos sp.]